MSDINTEIFDIRTSPDGHVISIGDWVIVGKKLMKVDDPRAQMVMADDPSVGFLTPDEVVQQIIHQQYGAWGRERRSGRAWGTSARSLKMALEMACLQHLIPQLALPECTNMGEKALGMWGEYAKVDMYEKFRGRVRLRAIASHSQNYH